MNARTGVGPARASVSISVAYAMKTAAVPTQALLPNEVELDAVRADLLEAAQYPMRADHPSLWLRRT